VPEAFSVRKHLQGDLLDFLSASGFGEALTIGLIRDLVCLLAAYREEDVPLFPEVFVLSAAATLSSLAPGAQRIVIGEARLDDQASAKVLKRCAGLALRGWGVYVANVDVENVEFGLFRAQRHSFATSAEESMADLDSNSPVVLIRNRGRLVVELRNAKGMTFTASFTSARAAPSALAKHVQEFVVVMSAQLPVQQSQRFRPYMERLLVEQLQHCHGTLLAALPAPNVDAPPPEQFSDGAWLQTPIDLAGIHETAVTKKDADSLADLQAAEALLAGMVNSDGVVVVGTNGTLLAYGVFLKPSDEEKKRLPDRGGGRRRTYELMALRLGSFMKAAFFRSQDGETDCQRASE
jgi:hypothetical protein